MQTNKRNTEHKETQKSQISSVDVEMAFDNIKYPFMIKTQKQKLRIEGACLNITRLRQPIPSILMGEAFPLNVVRVSTPLLFFRTILIFLTKAIRQEKEVKRIQEERRIQIICRQYDCALKDTSDSSQKLLNLINTFNKISSSKKINIQSPVAFYIYQ